jgi:hypothetical protein
MIKFFALIQRDSQALWLTKLTRNFSIRNHSTGLRCIGSEIRHKNFFILGKCMPPPLALWTPTSERILLAPIATSQLNPVHFLLPWWYPSSIKCLEFCAYLITVLPESLVTKIWSRVPRNSKSKMTVLTRTRNNLPGATRPDPPLQTDLPNDYQLSRKAASLNYFGIEHRKMLADMVSIFRQPWASILYVD